MGKTTDHVRIAQISLALFLIAVISVYKSPSVGPRSVSHEVLHSSSSSSSAPDISQRYRHHRSHGLQQTSRVPSTISLVLTKIFQNDCKSLKLYRMSCVFVCIFLQPHCYPNKLCPLEMNPPSPCAPVDIPKCVQHQNP